MWSALRTIVVALTIVKVLFCEARILSVRKVSSTQANFHGLYSKQGLDPREIDTPRGLHEVEQMHFESDRFSASNRRLQKFQARYSAGFQVLQRRGSCTGQNPVIWAICGGEIQLETTSDASIVCSDPARDGSTSYIECKNTCSTDLECGEIFLNEDKSLLEGPFGEIFFSCSGDFLGSLEAWVSFEDSGDTSCQAFPGETDDPASIHFGRLGIFCNDQGTYSFEDSFFECNATSIPLGGSEPGDDFVCGDGKSTCTGSYCTVDYDTVVIWTDLSKIREQCFQSLTGEAIPLPTTSKPEPTEFLYTAKFVAEWGLFRDTIGVEACTAEYPAIRINCTNGQIREISKNAGTVSCTEVGSNVLECTDSGTPFEQFSGVTYECYGRVLPKTQAEYMPGDASCDATKLYSKATVSHKLRLGVECTFDGETAFYYSDYNFECAEENDFSDSGNENESKYYYTCSQSVTFPKSASVQTQTVDRVFMKTDSRWDNNEETYKQCHSKEKAPPTFAPTTPPWTSQPTDQSAEVDEKPPVAAIAGGAAAAGVVVIGVIVFFAVRYLRNANSSRPIKHVKEPNELEEPSHTVEHTDFANQPRPGSPATHATHDTTSSPRRDVYPGMHDDANTDVHGDDLRYSNGAGRFSNPGQGFESGHPSPIHSAHDLRFKHQSRTVTLDTIDGVISTDNPSRHEGNRPTPQQYVPQAVPMVDVHPMDNYHHNSSNDMRRPAEPTGRVRVEP